VRALHSTMAEWERATGANFVHIVADDTPYQDPHFTPAGDDSSSAQADCAPGTKAYFGVFSFNSRWQGKTTAAPQAWNDPELEPLAGGVLPRLLQIQSDIIASFG